MSEINEQHQVSLETMGKNATESKKLFNNIFGADGSLSRAKTFD